MFSWGILNYQMSAGNRVQHRKTVWEVPGESGGWLPDTAGEGASKGKRPTGTAVCGQRGTGGWCDGQRQSWAQPSENHIHSWRRKGISKTLPWYPWGRHCPLKEPGGVPGEKVLRGKGVQEDWTFFKKELFKAQEQADPMCQFGG